MNNLPEGQLARAGIVGSTAVKLGVSELKRRTKKRFGSEEGREALDDQLNEQQAKLLFDTLTKLKGTAIKLAQMMSMETDLLPEKYTQELAKSYHQVPPLNRVLVNKVIQQELGDSAKNLYKSFDSTAFAAASLGQVHKAKVDKGTGDVFDVAVKIQYPGIHVAMDSDIKLLRKLAHALPNRSVVDKSITEVHARLCEELDYNLEAETTRWFSDNIRIEGVEIPTVHDSWCSKRVITTQLLNGKHLDDWLDESPSQELRDSVAQKLYDLFAHSTLELKRLHADPNPGNYLFRDDGTIGLIDFGCVRSFSDTFTENLPPLLCALHASDEKAVFDAYDAIGMKYKGDRTDMFERVLKPFGQWLATPFENDSFDFKKNKKYTSVGRDLIHRLAKVSEVDTLAEEFIFFDRTVYGLCKIFEQMEATVSMRHHWYK